MSTMLELIPPDSERQKDEILAISNILDSNEFRYQIGATVECNFNIFPDLNGDRMKITCDCGNNGDAESETFFLDHLPPIRLRIKIPQNYPSKVQPNFLLTISWLPPWEISFVCQKLDEIWLENKGCEILFVWMMFLKNNALSFLGIDQTLDISFMYTVYTNPEYYVQSRLMFMSDPRAINKALWLNPTKFLKDYCKEQRKVQFEKDFFVCPICFEKYNGKQCMELNNCSHIFCKECMHQYVETKINDTYVKHVRCPNLECNLELTLQEIQTIAPNIASKYENMLLQLALNTMSDIVQCPRRTCGHPVVRDTEDTLSICDKCNYSFCSFCNKAYHGVEPCKMEADEAAKLIASYRKADKQQKLLLRKRYGKKQIEAIVENYLTKEYIKDNTKLCPSCHAATEKIDGCNKMHCAYCQVSFCWICGALINTTNPYDHFTKNGNSCYGRLFEGMDALNLEENHAMDNVLWFNEQIEHMV